MTNQRPTITDAEGRSLLGRTGDLRARLLLNGLAFSCLDSRATVGIPGLATLANAERYLADRLAYELFPSPKGMVRLHVQDEA